MRPDYCPVNNEPCQAMCLDPCRAGIWPDAPDVIYLQVCEDSDCTDSFHQHESEGDGVTWCRDKINDRDIKYVRVKS